MIIFARHHIRDTSECKIYRSVNKQFYTEWNVKCVMHAADDQGNIPL